jgi:hypothetical protein
MEPGGTELSQIRPTRALQHSIKHATVGRNKPSRQSMRIRRRKSKRRPWPELPRFKGILQKAHSGRPNIILKYNPFAALHLSAHTRASRPFHPDQSFRKVNFSDNILGRHFHHYLLWALMEHSRRNA